MSDGGEGPLASDSDTYRDVQAVLLDSEGDPRDEVVEALRAVIDFAVLELDMGPQRIRALFTEVISELGP